MTETLIAVDLGATSGRVIAGHVTDSMIKLEQISRFSNGPSESNGHLFWDMDSLLDAVLKGIRSAKNLYPGARSVGVDSWGVDYCLLADGKKIGQPSHYRDPKNLLGVSKVKLSFSDTQLFQKNGLQFLPFNTIFQLASEDFTSGSKSAADALLLIPDFFNFMLTGKKQSEITNASTTGLLSVNGDFWDSDLIAASGTPAELFQGLIHPGTVISGLSEEMKIFVGGDLQVVSVASHDTASAVVATPIEIGSAYISCGTWGLVGLELSTPILSEAARVANFTNERGYDSTYRFLHNVMGLWLLNETVAFWKAQDPSVQMEKLLVEAETLELQLHPFDVNDDRFLEPGDMPSRITSWYRERNLPGPNSRQEFVWTILNSIAFKFAKTVSAAGELAAVEIHEVVMVGGGSQSSLLCKLTAEHSGLPVRTGPVEATAIGNILIQAATLGLIPKDLESMRDMVRLNFESKTYHPKK